MLYYTGRQRVVGLTNNLVENAKVSFYVTGTDTPAPVYTESTLTTAHTQPVRSNSAGFLPPIYLNPAITYKSITTDENDATLPDGTVDPLIQAAFDQASIGGALNPQTLAEIAAGVEPTNLAYGAVPEDVRRFGAVDTGGSTDSTAAIQDAIDALNSGSISGGAVVIPGDANSVYNISASISIPARASGDNHVHWQSVKGMGRGAPRIKAISGMANQPMITAPGQDASTYSFYREFKDLYLQGAGIAQRGIELYYNQHFKVENVFINGLEDGSDTASGMRVFGAICAQFRDVKVHNGDGHGIFAHGGSGNFFNANLIEGCSFLDLAGDGINITGGLSGCGLIGNTFEFCDGYGIRLAGYSGTGGFIGGNYFESNGLGDILIGLDTTANNVVFEGNYLNGYGAGVSATTYTPIRIKFADGVVIRGNMVAQTPKSPTGFLLLDANISGGSVSNCEVAFNQVRSLAAATAPNTIYNLNTLWVYFGNKLVDPTFAPLIQSNMLGGERLPYSWSATVSGTGTFARGGDLFGAPAVLMTRPAASTCLMSRTVTLTASQKNRFVTFAVPVQDTVGAGPITITATPNGTSPMVGTLSVSSLAAGAETILYAMCFVPADATTISLAVTLTNTATFLVGHPCLYVGAQQWYSSAGHADWRNDTAPSNGAWLDGDKVWLLNAVSGAKMGFVCTAAGSPGTWLDLANIA